MKILDRIKKWFESEKTKEYYLTIPEIKCKTNDEELTEKDSEKILYLEEKLEEITAYLYKKYEKFVHLDPFFSSWIKVDREDELVEKIFVIMAEDDLFTPKKVVKTIESATGFKVGKIKEIKKVNK